MALPKHPRKSKPRGRHPEHALSTAFVRNVSRAGRYCDGNGLYLEVKPSGTRSWIQRLVIRGRRRELGLGGFPLVSLKEARARALANRQAARTGGDPLAEKQRARGMPTFAEATERVWADKHRGWRNPQHARDWLSSLTRYVLPRIGRMPVCDVTSADVLLELEGIHSELIIDAYKHFRSVLQEKSCNPEDVYRGVARLNIVDVTLDRGVDNPQLVFESMNSTGIDLRQSDLVRNFLLMGLEESEQTRLYDEYWSKIESLFRTSQNALDWFLRDYMALKQGLAQQIRLDRVYGEFKTFRNRNRGRPLEELLVDMARVARTYASFLGIAPMVRPWLSEAMSHMRSLNTTQGLLIMRLYEYHEKDSLSQEEFVRAVALIESYLLRRAVLGLQTRGYWSVFARIAHDLDPSSVFNSLQVELARLRGNSRYPSDEEFKRGIQEHDLYGLRVCKHILDRLENAGFHEPSPVQKYSIEHIMPQEIKGARQWQEMLGSNWAECHETHLHRLGNLTLTAYNSTYSNRPFEEKKSVEGGFRQSAVRLNEDVRDQTRWTATEIETRGARLATRALGIWPHHEADAQSIQAADVRELKKRSAKQNASELEMDDIVRQMLDECC